MANVDALRVPLTGRGRVLSVLTREAACVVAASPAPDPSCRSTQGHHINALWRRVGGGSGAWRRPHSGARHWWALAAMPNMSCRRGSCAQLPRVGAGQLCTRARRTPTNDSIQMVSVKLSRPGVLCSPGEPPVGSSAVRARAYAASVEVLVCKLIWRRVAHCPQKVLKAVR